MPPRETDAVENVIILGSSVLPTYGLLELYWIALYGRTVGVCFLIRDGCCSLFRFWDSVSASSQVLTKFRPPVVALSGNSQSLDDPPRLGAVVDFLHCVTPDGGVAFGGS